MHSYMHTNAYGLACFPFLCSPCSSLKSPFFDTCRWTEPSEGALQAAERAAWGLLLDPAAHGKKGGLTPSARALLAAARQAGALISQRLLARLLVAAAGARGSWLRSGSQHLTHWPACLKAAQLAARQPCGSVPSFRPVAIASLFVISLAPLQSGGSGSAWGSCWPLRAPARWWRAPACCRRWRGATSTPCCSCCSPRCGAWGAGGSELLCARGLPVRNWCWAWGRLALWCHRRVGLNAGCLFSFFQLLVQATDAPSDELAAALHSLLRRPAEAEAQQAQRDAQRAYAAAARVAAEAAVAAAEAGTGAEPLLSVAACCAGAVEGFTAAQVQRAHRAGAQGWVPAHLPLWQHCSLTTCKPCSHALPYSAPCTDLPAPTDGGAARRRHIAGGAAAAGRG